MEQSGQTKNLDSRENAVFVHLILQNGKAIGVWRRTLKTKSIHIDVKFFNKILEKENKDLVSTINKYSNFLGLPVTITF